MNSVLASHLAAPGSNLGQYIFLLLLSLWTVLRPNPSNLKSKGFRKCRAAKAEVGTVWREATNHHSAVRKNNLEAIGVYGCHLQSLT